jgi:lipoyl(octanoyl) transferase
VQTLRSSSTRAGDVRAFVAALESWVIETLDRLAITAHVTPGRVGVWVPRPDKGSDAEDKIAAIGIRVRRWISYHGLSVNVAPDIAHFSGIVPCGIADQGVTSLADLGVNAAMQDLDAALHQTFQDRFGPCEPGPAPLVISR